MTVPTTTGELAAALRRDGLARTWERLHRAETEHGDQLLMSVLEGSAAWMDAQPPADLIRVAQTRFHRDYPGAAVRPRVFLVDEPCIAGHRVIDGPIMQLLVAAALPVEMPDSQPAPSWTPGTLDHRPQRRPNAGMVEDTHHPTTPSRDLDDDTVERALANLASVPAATEADIDLIRHMLTDEVPYTTSGRP